MPHNWSDLMSDNRPTIPVAHEVEEFEIDATLPLLLGTPRQVAWARNIRYQFLREVFAQIMEATTELDREEAKAVFECLDELRANRKASEWIEVYRQHLGDAVWIVMKMPSIIAARQAEERRLKEEQDRRQRKSAENRRVTLAAGRWEMQKNLPKIIGKSVAQTNFARRCRYLLLKDVQGCSSTETDAGHWIAQYLRTQGGQKDRASEVGS